MEGFDYDDIYASVARLEMIHIFLAYAVHKSVKVHKMDVKRAFLNSELKEEVYLQQPLDFENLDLSHHCYK